MNKHFKALLSMTLAAIMVISLIPNGAFTTSAVNINLKTGDIIEYGTYPQSKVTDSNLIAILNSKEEELSVENTLTYGISKYKKVYFTQYTTTYQHITEYSSSPDWGYQDDNGYFINTVYWFKYEPLKWRVLSNTNGELFVMAESIIDSKFYNYNYSDTTWETCTLRSWLNNNFYYSAFTSAEQSRIITSPVINDDNPFYGYGPGGNDTNDKIFALSYDEVMNTAYGFVNDLGYDGQRKAQGTDYAKSQGLYVYDAPGESHDGDSLWWLRSPGVGSNVAGFIKGNGNVEDIGSTTFSNLGYTHLGIRPALRIYQAFIGSTPYKTGDIIEYGSYPQSKVTDTSLITALNSCSLSAEQTVMYNGEKYRKVIFSQYTPYFTGAPATTTYSYQDDNGYYINTVYWFKFEPIRWRVLSNNNGELLVLAENIIESRAYNQIYTSITWETSTLRSWLNNDFYNSAFSVAEKSKIETSNIVNPDYPSTPAIEGGNDTTDKIFILSANEVWKSSYGFTSSGGTDAARKAQGTEFSKSQGLYVDSTSGSSNIGNSKFWLRTPGVQSDYACYIGAGGEVYNGTRVYNASHGVRPAFRIKLSAEAAESGDSFAYNNQSYEKDLAVLGAKLVSDFDKNLTIKETLKEEGYDYKNVEDMPYIEHVKDDINGMGFILAHKKLIGGENLITVIIQGTVDMQWTGDMNITGDEYDENQHDHYSFKHAKEIVRTRLDKYLSQYTGKKILFITGHSRGAAVANLLAKDMTDDNYTVYAYTFATPNVSLDAATTSNPNETIYKNIYNLCFVDDFVAQSPLSAWGYGKYGITYWATAQDLYDDGSKPYFKTKMDEIGTNDFDKRETSEFVSYMTGLNPSRKSYYNTVLSDSFPPYATTPDTTHSLLAYKIAPILFNNNWYKAGGIILTLDALKNETCVPIIWFFGKGGLKNTIKSTHEPFTYYSAIMNDGFDTTGGAAKNSPDTVSDTKLNLKNNSITGAEVTNANADELQKLKTFAQQGSNLTALGWDINNISTWAGITWNDGTENRVQKIDLRYKNLTGTLDLSGFSGLKSLNCAGNLLTAINFSGCSSLLDVKVPYNSLTGILLADSSLLETLDCSWNQITSIGINNCAVLRYLYCEQNKLTAINVSNNPGLIELFCGNNSLTQLDVSANAALKTLGCDNNYLDVQAGSALNTKIQNILVQDNGWVSSSPQKVPETATFNAADIAALTAFANTDSNREKLGWDLAAPNGWNGIEWTKSGNEFRLKEIHIEGLELTGTLNLSGTPTLTNLSCNDNALTALNLNGCTSLQYLSCKNSRIQSLNITNCTAITNLSCENNYLDVSEGGILRNSIDSILITDREFIVFNPQMVLAEVSSCNATEYNTLKTFAQTGNNTTLLNWNFNKPGEWPGIVWKLVNGEYRVKEISFEEPVSGSIDLTGFAALLNADFSYTNITSIVLPDSMTEIKGRTFFDCTSLENVSISRSISTISNSAFEGCSSLTEINVDSNNPYYSSIDGVLFDKAKNVLVFCPAFKTGDYEIPSSVMRIESGAFLGTSRLTSVSVPSSIECIETLAFSGCTNMEKITVQGETTILKMLAISGCSETTITCALDSPAETYAIKNSIPYILFPEIIKIKNSNIIIDRQNRLIYGLNGTVASLEEIIGAVNGSAMVVTPSGGLVCGTGSTVDVTVNGEILKTYKVVIFGDVNGDGNTTGLDAGAIVNVENYMAAWDPVIDAAQIKAADVNGDGNINGLDAGILVDVENYVRTIDQTTGLANMS